MRSLLETLLRFRNALNRVASCISMLTAGRIVLYYSSMLSAGELAAEPTSFGTWLLSMPPWRL